MLEHGSFQFSFKLTLGLYLKLQWEADIRNLFDAFHESFERTLKTKYKTTMESIQTDACFPVFRCLLFQTFYTCVWCLVLETGDFIFKIPNLCANQ